MKSVFIFLTVFWFSPILFAQDMAYQNAWINYDAQYLKLEIIEDGIYKISHEELEKAGLKSFKNISLWHHGRQVQIETSNEIDGKLASNGYINFYAEKNKGDLDSLVYENKQRNNVHHSLFSDVAAYYLTNSESPPSRINSKTLTIPTTEGLYYEEQIFAPNLQYSFNNSIGLLPLVMQSYYEAGEGWTGKYISSDSTANIFYSLPGWEKGQNVNLSLQLNGRSLTNHSLSLQINEEGIQEQIDFEPFGIIRKSIELKKLNSNKIHLKFKPNFSQKFDWYSISIASFKYLRKINDDLKDRTFNHFNAIPIQPEMFTYDISNRYTPVKLTSASGGIFNYNNNNTNGITFIGKPDKKPKNIVPVKFTKLAQNANFILITDPSLSASVQEYANYRESAKGGGFKTTIVYMTDIYEQFFYGEKNPMAVFNYLKYAVKDRKNTNLLLVGKATTFPDVLKSTPDMVPSFGYPASDLMLSSGPDRENPLEWIPTGRISAISNEEVLNYLDKVKEHEANLSPDWRQNGLHITGGQNQFELFVLKNLLKSLEPSLNGQQLNTALKTKNKATDKLVEQLDISAEINKGIGFVTYAGHGSTSELDYNIGFCSDPKRNINNAGKYPLMFFNGCGVGNVFYRYNVLSSDWLLTPNKGAIAVLANSYWSYANSTQQYLTALYGSLFENTNSIGKRIGESQILALKQILPNAGDPYVRSAIDQVLLQGDPALKMFPLEKPDLAIASNGIFIQSENGLKAIKSTDSIRIGTFVGNNGRLESELPFKIQHKIMWDNGQETVISKSISTQNRNDTLFIPLKKIGAIRNIKTEVQYEKVVDEYTKANNSQELKIQESWDKISASALYPESVLPDNTPPTLEVTFDDRIIRDKGIVASNVEIKMFLNDERSLFANENDLIKLFDLIDVSLSKCSTCKLEKIKPNDIRISETNSNQVTFYLNEQDLKANEYSIVIKIKDKANNSPANVYEKRFVVSESPLKTKIEIIPNPVLENIQTAISIYGMKNPLKANFRLIDITGREIYKNEIEPKIGENSIIIKRPNSFKAGIYYLKTEITHENGSVEKIVKKVILL